MTHRSTPGPIRWAIAAFGLYLLGLGLLAGMAVERFRFDARRAAVLRQYDDTLRRWHTHLMEIEKEPGVRRFAVASE